MGEHAVVVYQLDSKHGSGQDSHYPAFDLDRFR
jgi:hypothetical protein